MVQKPSRRTVVSDYSRYPVTLCCATCGRCRRGSACRYDCLRFLVRTVICTVPEHGLQYRPVTHVVQPADLAARHPASTAYSTHHFCAAKTRTQTYQQ